MIMSVLVTGGAGFIGSHMVHELVDSGEDVVVLDALTTGFRWAVAEKAKLVVGDAGDQGLVRALIRKHGIQSIIHFAGSIVVPESVSDPLGYYHNNTVKSRSLIEAAVLGGVKNFIFSSTAAVYGNPEVMPVSEDARLKPESPYGTSKLMTELMLADTARAHDFRYVALRYFNVAGADPRGRTGQSTPRATHLIKVACESAVGKRSGMDVFGTDYATRDGTCIRDYIHVTDLARAHSAALDYLRRGGTSEILNCGYGRGFTVLEVIAAVKKASGVDFTVKMGPRRAGDAEQIIAKADRIRETLGWQPRLENLDTIVTSFDLLGVAFRQHDSIIKVERWFARCPGPGDLDAVGLDFPGQGADFGRIQPPRLCPHQQGTVAFEAFGCDPGGPPEVEFGQESRLGRGLESGDPGNPRFTGDNPQGCRCCPRPARQGSHGNGIGWPRRLLGTVAGLATWTRH
jgi:UDP-glucose 4-epimerase